MVIMPTGKNYYDWSLGKDGKVVKTAGNGKKTITQGKSDRDPMYEAAEKFMASRKTTKKAQFDFGGKDKSCAECGGPIDGAVDSAVGGEVTDVSGPIDGAVGDVGGEAGEFGGKDVSEVAEDVGGSLEEVVKEVSQALGDAKSKLDSVSGGGDILGEKPEGEVEEIEFEIGGDEFGGEKDEKEGDTEEIPGLNDEVEEKKDEGEEGIAKKSEDDKPCADKAPCKDEKKDKKPCGDKAPCNEEKKEDKKDEKKEEKVACAKTIGEFTKMSEISPTTRKKVYTYWSEYLGYPKDFCKLMVTDYEKK